MHAEGCVAVVSHSAFLTALFVVLTTEEGLRNNGANGTPDIVASTPGDVASASPQARTSARSSTDGKKEKVYFTNGEVKSVVLLPM
jgi:hypothetical protein